jgi:hypothetical protein
MLNSFNINYNFKNIINDKELLSIFNLERYAFMRYSSYFYGYNYNKNYYNYNL